MIGELIGGVVSAAGMILGKTFINKLSSNKESSITPAMPTVVEKMIDIKSYFNNMLFSKRREKLN